MVASPLGGGTWLKVYLIVSGDAVAQILGEVA
jgi:hypothetical protein